MSTYVELQDEVISHNLNDTKYRPYVKQWINEAQRIVALRTSLRTQQDSETYATANGVAVETVPSDFARIIDIRNSDTQDLLQPIELRQFDDLPSSSGQPYYYVLIGSEITLYPTPDGIYPLVLRYWKMPADLSADNDEPGIPERYHHLLVRFALMRAYQRENDYEAATFFKNEFEYDLAKAQGEIGDEAYDGPRQVPGTWDEGVVETNRWF